MSRFLLLLLYVGGCIWLNVHLRKNPSLFKGRFIFSETRLLKVLWGIWGASLWPLLGLLWIVMPAIKSAWAETVSLAPVLFLVLGFYIPLLLFLSLLAWLKLFSFATLGMLALLPLVLFLLLFQVDASLLPPIAQLLPFLFFIVIPPLISLSLLIGWINDLLPVETGEQDNRRSALALLCSFFTGFPKPSWIIEQGKIVTRIKGSPLMGTGPGWVMTEVENAVVLKGRSEIRRIVGPGGIFTRQDEDVHAVIDLRPQLRVARVDALTQDGIRVTLPVGAVFSIDPGSQPLRLKSRWPYAREAAWRAVFAAEVNPADRTPLDAHFARPWSDMPLELAKPLLKQIMMDYNLDALYNVPPSQPLPRLQISEMVLAQLRDLLAPKGFHIEGWFINQITPVDEAVTQQRIEAWKARWIRQLMAGQGEMQARRIEHVTTIRDKVRFDLLAGLIARTNEMLQENTTDNFRINLVVYHLVESLESIAREPDVQFALPESALLALTDLRQRMEEKPQQ